MQRRDVIPSAEAKSPSVLCILDGGVNSGLELRHATREACQTRGELNKAAQMYLQFLGLDATNPMGYLRLGECLLAAKEFSEAQAAFLTAKEFAEEGKGQPGNLEEALKLLAIPEIAAAAPAAV